MRSSARFGCYAKRLRSEPICLASAVCCSARPGPVPTPHSTGPCPISRLNKCSACQPRNWPMPNRNCSLRRRRACCARLRAYPWDPLVRINQARLLGATAQLLDPGEQRLAAYRAGIEHLQDARRLSPGNVAFTHLVGVFQHRTVTGKAPRLPSSRRSSTTRSTSNPCSRSLNCGTHAAAMPM